MDLAQLIPDSTPHCLLVLDEELSLVYGNANFHRFLEENFGSVIEPGQSVLSLLPDQLKPIYQLRLSEVLSGQCARLEQSIEINGFTRYFDVTSQPVATESEWDKVVITFDEITHRKRREIRMVDEDEALREALATRQTLLSVISHDLRSPIFQLNGLLFLIRQSSEARDEARLQMHADDLEERISHLTHTLDNLLSWSSLQRQSLEPRVSVFSLQTVVDHAVGLLKPACTRKDIRVYSKGFRDLKLSSDQEMVAFLVRNLVGNSIKFSQQSGKIEISGEETRDGIRFVVRDHGVGMQLNQLDRYGKADSYPSQSGTWGERGTGLGLKLCYEFVSRLEGSIEIGPAEGGGTQATVDLPRI